MNTLKFHISTILKGFSLLMNIEKKFVIYKIIYSIVSPLTPYVNIFMSAKLVDELLTTKDINTLITYVIITISLNILLSIICSGLNHLVEYHRSNFYKCEHMYFAKKNMSMDYEHMENSKTTFLRERVLQESRQGFNLYYLYSSINRFIESFIQIAMSFGLTSALIFDGNINVWAKILVGICIVLVIYSNFIIAKKKNKIDMTLSEESVPANVLFSFYTGFLADYNSGKDIRLYNMEDLLANEVTNMGLAVSKLFAKHLKVYLKYDVILSTLSNLLNICIYIFMIFACVSGSISLGSVVKYVSCITLFIQGFNNLIYSIQTLCNNNKYLERYISYFEIKSKLNSGNLTLENIDNYEFEFKNVSFKYPESNSYTLKNLSFKLNEGNKVAVVGMSGSGKTTMIKLLCRLYDPTEGEITLNGIDVREYDYDEYLKAFGIVFQDFNLFSFSIGQNVAISDEYDKEKVTDVLEKAGLSDRLKKMKYGVDTALYKDFDDEGVEISGGEGQKIALARSIYKNAKFIILDEPTAALDPIAESEIYSKFNSIVEDKTTVYISHRLASCKFCDDILVFENGEIIERGSHNDLLDNFDGRYSELWNAQAQYYQAEIV